MRHPTHSSAYPRPFEPAHRAPSPRAARTLGAVLCALAAALVVAGSPSSGAGGEFFTCEDAQGRISIQDIPCPGGTKTVARTVAAEETAAPEASPPPTDPPAAPDPTESAPATAASRATRPPGGWIGDAPVAPGSESMGMLAKMLLRARLAGVLSQLHNLRNHVMMHYAEFGAYPTLPEDMGLDSKTMSSDQIASVHFGADGTILAELAPSFGSGRRVALVPEEVLGGATLQWICVANYPEQALSGPGGDICASRTIAKPGSPGR